jgi:hypothetical protein
MLHTKAKRVGGVCGVFSDQLVAAIPLQVLRWGIRLITVLAHKRNMQHARGGVSATWIGAGFVE